MVVDGRCGDDGDGRANKDAAFDFGADETSESDANELMGPSEVRHWSDR